MYLSFFVILIIIIIISALFIIKKINDINQSTFILTNQKRQHYLHTALLDILKSSIKVFKKFNVPYFIHSGTLLGAVRGNDIIPHDDDIDIGILNQYKDILLSDEFSEELKKYNLKISYFTRSNTLFKIKYLNSNNSIFIDVFLYDYISNNQSKLNSTIHYKGALYRKTWPKQYFKSDELFPFKEYILKDLTVTGPHYPCNYLKRAYGKDWRVPKITHNHTSIIKFNKNCNGGC